MSENNSKSPFDPIQGFEFPEDTLNSESISSILLMIEFKGERELVVLNVTEELKPYIHKILGDTNEF